MATLENGLVAAEILLDKGANVRQFRHVPTATRTLAESNDWADHLADFCQGGRRGVTYSDHYEGGWQDVLPARARWRGGSIEGADGVGEAAIVPWYVARSLCTPAAACVTCHATLPRTRLSVEKEFRLRRGSATLTVRTSVQNPTPCDVRFSWTQHPALGGDLLDSSSHLWLPLGQPGTCRSSGADDGDSVPSSWSGWIPSASLLPPHNAPDRFLTLADVTLGRADLVSYDRHLGVRLRWDTAAFPHLWLWLANRDAIKCVAPEPSTTYLPESLPRPRAPLFRLLRAGHSLHTSLSLSVFRRSS